MEINSKIHIKPSVWFYVDVFARPEITRIPVIVVRTSPPGYEPTITSAGDGVHKEGSRHYSGKAFDFRINDLPTEISVKTWVNRIQASLGNDYFVLLEQDHIHVQWNG